MQSILPSAAVAGKKTGHADEEFVRNVCFTLAGVCECSEEDLSEDFCFHNITSSRCGRNEDGTLSIKAVTKVGVKDAMRAWFGAWNMAIGHYYY